MAWLRCTYEVIRLLAYLWDYGQARGVYGQGSHTWMICSRVGEAQRAYNIKKSYINDIFKSRSILGYHRKSL